MVFNNTRLASVAVTGVVAAAALSGLSACGAAGGGGGSAADCDAPLTIAHATNEVWGLAPKLAEADGFFDEHGIEIKDQVLFEGDSQVAQALQSGQAQVGLASGYPVLGTLGSGRPMVMTALLAAKETDMLVAKSDIKSPQDLEGKVMAINDVGGGTHAATVWALEALGVDPDDVTFTQVGAESDRLAAVIGGSAATGPVDRAQRQAIEKQGLHVLIDLSETDVTSAKHGVIFMQSFVDKCGDTVDAFTHALADAQAEILNNPQRAGEVLAEWGEFDAADGVKTSRTRCRC